MEPELGEAAFNAYVACVGGVTHDGKPIPTWADLTNEVREGWMAAASAVVAAAEDRLRDRAPYDPPEGA